MGVSMIKWLRFLSRHGRVEEKRKALKRNWKAVRKTLCSYAREGNYYAYYHGFIYEKNVDWLRAEGLEVEKQKNPLGSMRWKISWEEK